MTGKLDREATIQRIRALQEKKRRQKLFNQKYKPNEMQKTVHLCDKLERYVFSGNSAGKTTLLIQEMLFAALGHNPYLNKSTRVPCKIICVIDDPDKIELKIIPEMRKWYVIDEDQLSKDGKPYYARIHFDNGSFIKFLTHAMEPMKAESIELDFLAADEPPPYHLYSSLTRGMRDKGSEKRTLVVGTPLAAPWLRKQVYEPWVKGELDYVHCFKFDSDVNKDNLDWDRQEKYFARLSDKERQIRRHGQFFDLEGLALAHLFKRDVHVVPKFEWPNWPCVVAIDPHPSKNHIAVLLGADNQGRLFCIKELSSDKTPKEFAKELRNFYQGFRIVDIVCDSLGAGDTTGGDGNKSFIQVLRENGVSVRSTTFEDKDDEDFIQRIQQVLEIPDAADNFGLTLPKLRIFEQCWGVVNDIECVEWLKYRNLDEFKPKLNISNRDFLACLKYALATNLVFLKRRPRPVKRKRSPWGNNKN